jgi:hypothetical protein
VSCRESVYEHVTSDVTRALCVTGLLEVWGTAREQGDRDGDDLVIDHCDLGTLDDITGLPCFGEAMAEVGWASEREDGSLVFPKFFADKASPEQRHRTGGAARQARYRQRLKQQTPSHSNGAIVTGDVTGDVTVTGQRREEKRREEDKNPPTPHGGDIGGEKSKRKKKTTAEAVPIPEHLDSPEFRVAWGEWLQDRSVRGKPVTEIAAKKQFADLLPHGPAKSIEIIRVSIKNGWTGLFPEKVSMPSVPTPNAVPPRLIHNVADLSKPNTLPPLYPVKQTVGT